MKTEESVVLSPVESYFWQFETDLAGSFRAAVLFRFEGCIEEEFLAAALKQIQRRHPKLRAAIKQGSDGRIRYEFDLDPPTIPYRIADFEEEETPWRQETHRLFQMELPACGPLAMVAVLRSRSRNYSELIFSVSHAIADGLSGIMLVDDLMKEYGKAEARLCEAPCSTLPLVTAKRAKTPGEWRGRLHLLRRFARLKRQEKRLQQTVLPESPGIPPQSQWVHWIFSREETMRLVRRCRKERVSLSGALVAAVYCGLMDCLPVSEARFTWQLPFNVREMLKGTAGIVTPSDLGCFVSNMNGSFSMSRETSFWDLARQVQEEIQNFIRCGGPSFGYNIASFFYNLGTEVRRRLSRPPSKLTPSTSQRSTLLATSYGVLNTSEAYGSLVPKGCTLIYKNDIVGPSLVLEALVMGQRLNVGFVADDLEPSFWESVQSATHKHLQSATA